MTALGLALALSALPGGGHDAGAAGLPICSNRTINEVVRRAGCTLGDTRCWLGGGGFCMDHVQSRLRARGVPASAALEPVPPGEVGRGDVAVFAARAHYAYVDRVVRDRGGRAVAVDLSEYNFGTCWVDRSLMVTDGYKVVSRRAAVPVDAVDGGFLRAHSTKR